MNFFLSHQRLDHQTKVVALVITLFGLWYLGLGIVFDCRQVQLPYFVTEWMVTYAGGFVRRGALGQTMSGLSSFFGVAPLSLIFTVRICLAVAYLSTMGFQLIKNRAVLGIVTILVLLSSPAVSLYVAGALGSLDLLFLCLSAFHVWLAKGSTATYSIKASLLFSTVGLYLALSHEGFLFLCLPLNLAVSWNLLKRARRFHMFLIYFVPVLACAVSVFFMGPSPKYSRLLMRGMFEEFPFPSSTQLGSCRVAFRIN